MATEQNIAYQIINIVRAGELNNDEVVGERRVRSFMRVMRSEIMNRYSKEGMTIQDVCFQKLKPKYLTKLNEKEFITNFPQLIYLPSNFGVRVMTPSFENIPVVNNESYQLSKRNPINQFKPKATIQNEELKVYVGNVSPSALNGGNRAKNVNEDIKINKKLNVSVVLYNPDDGLNYDWTKSEYPFPPEAEGELIKNVLRRNFDIIIKTKSDQVPNAKNDTLRYHDQDDVNR